MRTRTKPDLAAIAARMTALFAHDCAVGLDQSTSVDAKHWGGYCLWKVPFYDPRRLGGVVLELDAVLAEDPEDARALALRGRARRVLGDLEGGRKDLEASLALKKDDAYALAALGDVKRALGRADGKRDFERAAAADPDFVFARLWKAAWDLHDGDFAAAEKALAPARGHDQGRAFEAILSGLTALGRRDAAAARGHFQRAAEADPKAPGAFIMRGKTELLLGREHDAAASYEKAIFLDHDCKVAYYSFLNCGDLPPDASGVAQLDAAARRFPDAAWTYALRAELRRMPTLADYREAAADLEKAERLDPKSPWIKAFLSRALANVGRGKEAMETIDRAIALDPECAWLRAWRGEALRKGGRLKEAERDLDDAIRLDDRYMFGWAWRGVTRCGLERWEDALTDLDRALDLNPWYHLAYAERARARLFAGDAPGGVEDMTLAAKLNPKYGWTHEAPSGRAAEGPNAALAALDAAAKRHPRDAWLHAWRGETRLRVGDRDGALACLDRALALDPALAWAWAWRGEARVRLEQGEKALPDLEKASALDPSYSRAWAWKGAALYQLKRYREAAAALDASIARDAMSAWAFGWRGRAKLELADFAGARADFDRALMLDRQYGEAYLGRAEAFRGLEMWAECESDASKALSCDPNRAQTYVLRAIAREKLGKFFDELLDFSRALRLSPKLFDEDARIQLRAQLLGPTIALLASGKAVDALGSLKVVLEADPSFAAAHALSADLKLRLKDPSALDSLNTAHGLNEYGVWRYLSGQWRDWPELAARFERGSGALSERTILDSGTYARLKGALDAFLALGGEAPAWALALRGEARVKIGQTEGAAADLRRALTLDPACPKAWAWLGESLYCEDDAKGALAAFDKAVKLAPDDAGLLAWRGQLKLWLGKYESARKDLDGALKRDAVWARAWRGACRLLAGDAAGALADLDAGLERDPRDVEALVWRSEARRLAGRLPGARADAERALELRPGYFWAVVARCQAGGPKAAEDLAYLRKSGPELLPSAMSAPECGSALEALRLAARGDRCRILPRMTFAARLEKDAPSTGRRHVKKNR